MILHKEKSLFEKCVLETAIKMDTDKFLIEKDYWVTYAIKKLFSSPMADKIVFKGGTSLSKCYRAINRFSEDIDLCLANYEGDTRAFRRSTMKRITKTLDQVLPQIEMPETRKEELVRTTCHAYHPVYESGINTSIKPYLKLEVTQMGNYEPFHTGSVQSYIADHLYEVGDQKTLDKYELKPFPVRVLGLERTFAEKISCLTQYSHALNPHDELGKRLRHIFDLHALMQRRDIRSYLQTPAFSQMLANVRKEERQNYRDNNVWLTHHPSKALIFQQPASTLKAMHAKRKETFSRMLIGTKMPDDHALADALSHIGTHLNNVPWYSPEEKKAQYIACAYRGMEALSPYDGKYTQIFIVQGTTDIERQKREPTLYIMPDKATERHLSRILELAKKDDVPLQTSQAYRQAYPEQYNILKELSHAYKVPLDKA